MVAPFSGAGIPVRPDRIEGAEGPNGGNEEASCAPTETDCTPTEIDNDEDAATTVIDEDEEEKQEVKILKKPSEPTQKEWEEHMVLHWPFRSWCPHCKW